MTGAGGEIRLINVFSFTIIIISNGKQSRYNLLASGCRGEIFHLEINSHDKSISMRGLSLQVISHMT